MDNSGMAMLRGPLPDGSDVRIAGDPLIAGDQGKAQGQRGGDNDPIGWIRMERIGQLDRFEGNGVVYGYEADKRQRLRFSHPVGDLHGQLQAASGGKLGHFPDAD